MPVSTPIAPSGRVEAGQRSDTRVAQTVYHGPYEGLPQAWGEFQAWVEDSEHAWAPDIWEVYLVGPDADPDPAGWRTEINRPLVD